MENQNEKYCNKCGRKIISEFEPIFEINRTFGYGSHHDLDKIDCVLCQSCFESLILGLNENCVIPIVSEWTGDPYSKYPYQQLDSKVS